MSPLSTNANLCRLLILPSGECSRTGMMYHSFIARRSEFGVAESRFGRSVLSHGVVEYAQRMDAYARVCSCQLRLHLVPVLKRCCRSSNETAEEV